MFVLSANVKFIQNVRYRSIIAMNYLECSAKKFFLKFIDFIFLQLISYAGYVNPDGSIIGDPINVDITEVYNPFIHIDMSLIQIYQQVCSKMGWKSKRTDFDILPLVLSANGHE